MPSYVAMCLMSAMSKISLITVTNATHMMSLMYVYETVRKVLNNSLNNGESATIYSGS
jgi:hypothetical protein